MIPSKTAALLTVVGSLVVGAVAGFSLKTYQDNAAANSSSDCPQVRNERNERKLRSTIYADLGMDSRQQAQWDSLIDLRRTKVTALYAAPRAAEDSIRAETWEKLKALLTADQRTRMADRAAAMQRARQERQARCEAQAANKNKNNLTGKHP